MSAWADALFAAAERRRAHHDEAGALVLLDEMFRDRPDEPRALRLAADLHLQSRPAVAVQLLQRVLRQSPDDAASRALLGRALSALGRHDEASHRFYEAALAAPSDPLVLTNYVVSLLRAGDPHAAAATAQRAIACNAATAPAHAALGHALNVLHRPEQALDAFAAALRLAPDFADALQGLARAQRELGRPSIAIAALLRASRLAPHLAGPLVELATLYHEFLQPQEAIEALDRAATLSPGPHYFASNRLLFRQYDPGLDPELAEAEACRWGVEQVATAPPKPLAPAGDRNMARPLRIGYVSADLGHHPVGWLGAAAIIAHDKQAVTVFVYANQRSVDPITEAVHRAVHAWRPIIGLDDAAAAALIASDGIDILVDLSGHTAGNRLGIFARRAAPIQLSWLGYSATTGLPTMDYSLLDEDHAPPGTDRLMIEQVVRLPRIRFAYSPPDYASEVAAPPSAAGRPPTFGSLNAAAKLNDGVIGLWSRVLRAVPGSRLLLKSRGFGDALLQSGIGARFARFGVAASRIVFDGHSPHADMLRRYAEVDVALDPFPFCGGVTSCEALWMGVPVVTLPAARPFSRQTHAILEAIGRKAWSAADADQYVATATRLAADPTELAAIRRDLRGAIRESPLCDGPGLARSLEEAFCQLWKTHVAPTIAK